MNVTVAILTRNRLEQLKECVVALTPQVESDDEILIIDTGSTDATLEWLATQQNPVRHLTFETTGGFAEARNFAVSNAAGDVVAFIDDDCIAPPDWLSRVRNGIKDVDAVGGLSLPGKVYRYPGWWSQEMCWAIGMTGVPVAAGEEGHYPPGANLVVKREIALAHPFEGTVTGFDNKQVYLAGREDAQWWANARLRGDAVALDTHLLVFHRIPQERIRLSYVMKRALADSKTSWERSPNPELLPSAIYDAAESCVDAVAGLLQKQPQFTRMTRAIWAMRQYGFVRQARKDRNATAPGFFSSVSRVLRTRVSKKFYSRLAGIQNRKFQLPATPERVLVLAPTFAGDCIVLQSPLYDFARNWPQAEVMLLTSHPRLFKNSPTNLTVHHDSASDYQDAINFVSHPGAVVFAPYYHSGRLDFWRSHFARRAVIFDREAGFTRMKDYSLAAMRVVKRPMTREFISLTALLNQWPANVTLQRPQLSPDPEAIRHVVEQFPHLKGSAFAAIQLGSGQSYKNWPDDRWFELARVLISDFDLKVLFVGGEDVKGSARTIAAKLPDGSAFSAAGQPLEELIATLSMVRIVIGADSAPKHLAMALNIPTFTLYGPTREAQWGTLFDRSMHGFVQSPGYKLTPSELAGKPENHAMQLLTVQMVASALAMHLKELQIQS